MTLQLGSGTNCTVLKVPFATVLHPQETSAVNLIDCVLWSYFRMHVPLLSALPKIPGTLRHTLHELLEDDTGNHASAVAM